MEVGDKVIRVRGAYRNWSGDPEMVKGDIDTVTAVHTDSVTLQHYGRGHSISSLEVIE